MQASASASKSLAILTVSRSYRLLLITAHRPRIPKPRSYAIADAIWDPAQQCARTCANFQSIRIARTNFATSPHGQTARKRRLRRLPMKNNRNEQAATELVRGLSFLISLVGINRHFDSLRKPVSAALRRCYREEAERFRRWWPWVPGRHSGPRSGPHYRQGASNRRPMRSRLHPVRGIDSPADHVALYTDHQRTVHQA